MSVADEITRTVFQYEDSPCFIALRDRIEAAIREERARCARIARYWRGRRIASLIEEGGE